MNNDKLYNQIKQLAEKDVPDLRQRIKQDQRFIRQEKPSLLKRLIHRPSLLMGTFSLAIILMIFVTVGLPQQLEASSSIFIEINPSVQIDLDEEDQVLKVIPLNEDARRLLEDLDNLEKLDVLVAVDAIIEKAIEKGHLSADHPVVLYDVISDSQTLLERLNDRIQAQIPAIAQQRLPNLDMVRGNAHSRPDDPGSNLPTPGHTMRHNLILDILEAYPDEYTYEELSSLSMGELRRLITNQDSSDNDNPNRPPMPNRP